MQFENFNDHSSLYIDDKLRADGRLCISTDSIIEEDVCNYFLTKKEIEKLRDHLTSILES